MIETIPCSLWRNCDAILLCFFCFGYNSNFLCFNGAYPSLLQYRVLFDRAISRLPAKSTATKPRQYTTKHKVCAQSQHDNVIKWKHFPCCWPFVRGIHRSMVNSPHKIRWRGALMHLLIYAWINGWVNNGEAGYLRRHHAQYDVTVVGYIVHINEIRNEN